MHPKPNPQAVGMLLLLRGTNLRAATAAASQDHRSVQQRLLRLLRQQLNQWWPGRQQGRMQGNPAGKLLEKAPEKPGVLQGRHGSRGAHSRSLLQLPVAQGAHVTKTTRALLRYASQLRLRDVSKTSCAAYNDAAGCGTWAGLSAGAASMQLAVHVKRPHTAGHIQQASYCRPHTAGLMNRPHSRPQKTTSCRKAGHGDILEPR
jgi:hypothetical protein